MATVVLISCSATKLYQKAMARDLYKGSLFIYSLAYAKKLTPDIIYILSAKYGLVHLTQEIEPYDITLSAVRKSVLINKPGLIVLSSKEKEAWGKTVIGQLKSITNLDYDRFILLAGKEYIKPIAGFLKNIEEPLKGMKQGERLQYLKKAVHG